MFASPIRRLGSLATILSLALLAGRAEAQFVWTATTSGNWSTASNWQGGVAPPVVGLPTVGITFNDGGTYTSTNDYVTNPYLLNSLTFNNTGANVVTLAGANPLDFVLNGATQPSITRSTGNVSITEAIQLGATGAPVSLTASGAAGTMTISGGVNDNGSSSSGGSNIFKTGTGTLAFTNASSTFNQLSVRNGAVTISANMNLNQPDPGTRIPGLQIGVGTGSTGAVTINNGAQVNVAENVFIGDATTASATDLGTGTLTVTGAGTVLTATGTTSGRFAVGQNGNGTLNITAGAVVNARFLLTNRTNGSSATILVDGVGSTLNVMTAASGTGALQIAANGGPSTANVTVSNGGTVTVVGNFFLASSLGNTGNFTVTGAGSSMSVSNQSQIASGGVPSGTGIFNVQNSATVSFGGGLSIGNNNASGFGGNGTLNISGTGSTATVTGQLAVAANPGSVAAINVTGGGTLNQAGNAFLGIFGASGGNPAANGTITVSGPGSTVNQTAGVLIDAGGATPGGTATINVIDGGLYTFNGTGQYVAVGQNAGSNGFLNVAGGGTFDATGFSVIVGGIGTAAPVAIGTVNVAGGQLNANQVTLGGGFTGTAGGNGVMNVSAGGLVNTNFMIVGGLSSTITGNGTLNVNGGKVLVSTELDLADGGAGALNISNGGLVNVGGLGFGGANASFTGAVTLNGYQSTLQINGQTQLGGQGGTPGGTGSVTANAGSQVLFGDTILYAGGSLAVNTGTNGSFTVNDVRDGVTGATPSIGTVAIGANSTLTINNTTNGFFQFDGVISGAGNLTKAGGGEQILTGANSYSGTTNVNGGILGFTAAGNLGTGAITFNGGTLQWLSVNTTDITAGPRVVTLNGGGGTFDTNFNSITLANPISGIGGLTVTGGGIVTLAGTNTYFGPTTIANGALIVTADANLGSATGPLGGVNTVSGTPAGTIIFAGTGGITTTRLFNMNGGTIATGTGQALTFNGSLVTGAVLDGSGTTAAPNFITGANGAAFNHVQTTQAVVVSSTNANDQFFHFQNGGAINVAGNVNPTGASTTLNYSDFNNLGSGSWTVGVAGQSTQVNVANFQSSGLINVAPATITDAQTNTTLVTNKGSSDLTFNGGGRTFIGTPATAVYPPTWPTIPNRGLPTFVAGLDLHGHNAIVAGALFVNNGYVEDSTGTPPFTGPGTVIADFGGLVKGAGYFQNTVQTRNGGKFQAGNSPGTASFGDFVLGTGGVTNYVVAIDNATGTAGPTPDANGSVSGWGLVKAVKQAFNGLTANGNFTFNADPSHKLTVSLDTLIDPTTVGSDVPGLMSNFDPTKPYSWAAVEWAGNYFGPTDAAVLNAATGFDLSGFQNHYTGTFGWSFDGSGHTLSLNYSPSAVPEPGTLALLGAAAAVGFRRLRRRK